MSRFEDRLFEATPSQAPSPVVVTGPDRSITFQVDVISGEDE
jgi:hypothetical protein